MAIVKMNKFTAIGINDVKDSLMTGLMEFGATELNSQDAKLAEGEWASFVEAGGRESEAAELELKLSAINDAINLLNGYDTAKTPLFASRRAISEETLLSCVEEKEETEAEASKVLELEERLRELKGARNKIETTIISLEPWKRHQLPLDMQETKYTCILTGIIPGEFKLDRMEKALEKLTDRFCLSRIGSDSEQHYVSLIYLKEEEEGIDETLKQYRFSTIPFIDVFGSAAENIARYKS